MIGLECRQRNGVFLFLNALELDFTPEEAARRGRDTHSSYVRNESKP